jgi:putative Ca2+/H+ antiporter (TMEM165/GDT1 family)
VLRAVIASLLLILVALGNKSSFIAAILAKRYSQWLIYVGAIAALAVITVLSVVVGKAASVLPQLYIIYYAKIAFFIGFGVKLLYEARQMPANFCDAIVQEAADAVKQAELKSPKQPTHLVVILEAFWLTSLAEWGNLSQIGTIALAASQSPVGVAIGAILGQGICTAIAVIGGRLLIGHFKLTLTFARGCLFLLFGVAVLLQGA